MKRYFTLIILLFVNFGLFAQRSYAQNFTSQKKVSHHKPPIKKDINFDGQWKGSFNVILPHGYYSIGGNTNDYVLELTTEGSQVTGYSYTYYQEGIKKYYTICRLHGTLDRETNNLAITEIERIKSNTPPDITNCFQIHKLHYEKDTGNIEVLRGTWIPAPNQACSDSGITVLSRRIVSNLPTGFMPHKNKSIAKAPVKKPAHKPSVAIAPKKTKPYIRMAPAKKTQIQKSENMESLVTTKDIPNQNVEKPTNISPAIQGFESRRKDIVKTIDISQPTFKLDFYDNGEIDGDSITVFYNGKVVLSHQRLSDKAISLTLTIDKNAPENIVTMYADNMGTIPPNTALMVVTDGGKRYEVRIESDYGKSGSVIFRSAK